MLLIEGTTRKGVMMLDLTAEDKYYYWLMISIGLDKELVDYIRACAESDEEISDLIFELYDEIQDKNALKRTLYLSHSKSTAVNKEHVKDRIVKFFYIQLLDQTFTATQIGKYLGSISALENTWSDFEWICENYSLAKDGFFSYDDADKRLCNYLKDNASIDAAL